jgi:hypothetical protein
MLDLRVANLEDLPAIVELVLMYCETYYMDGPADADRIAEVYSGLLTSDTSVVLLILDNGIPVGLFSGTVTPGLCNFRKTALEVMFWIHPDYRTYKRAATALKAFEYWAKNIQGATSVLVGALEDRVGVLYKRQGYDKIETHYRKELLP